jgi:WD40 repeat protein
VVSGGYDGRVLLWHRDRPGQPVELGTHNGWVTAVAVGPDGSWMSLAATTGGARLWHLNHPGQPVELDSHPGRVSAVAVGPSDS